MRYSAHAKRNLVSILSAGALFPVLPAGGLFPSTPAGGASSPCLEPPALEAPIVFEDKCPEDPGGPLNVNAYGRDVLIRLPTNRSCSRRLSVVHGRNVHITGGELLYGDDLPQAVSIGMSEGITFIEGLHIDVNKRFADAIRFYRHTGTAIVQNTLIEGVSGIATGTHGDVVHAQGGGPLTELVLQNVSGYTGYQGLFTPYRTGTGHGAHKLRLDGVNLAYDPKVIVTKPLMLLYIGDFRNTLDQPPDQGTDLADVFVDGSVRNFPFDRAIYTRPERDAAGCATFAPQHRIDGQVCDGAPPEGDFAPAAQVGLNYDRDAFCKPSSLPPSQTPVPMRIRAR